MRQAAHRKPIRDFAIILMLAAVTGAITQVIGTVIELGRSAAWWP